MKIANIVSTNTISAPEDFNVVKSIDKIINGLPTLIVGFDVINKLYPDFDITESHVVDNIYWCFKKTEDRDKHSEGLNRFIYKVYDELINGIEYVFVDPLQYNQRTLTKIIRKIYSLKNKISYQAKNKMIYIYGDKLVFGIDIHLLNFIGFDTNKLINKIKYASKVFLTDNEVFIDDKISLGSINNKFRYIPYLYSLKHAEDNNIGLIHIDRES